MNGGEKMNSKIAQIIILNTAVIMSLINVFGANDDLKNPVRPKYLCYTNSQGEKGTTTYLYDRLGLMYASVWRLDDGSRHSYNIYRYDTQGRMTEFYREFSDGVTLNEFYEYDKEGRRSKDYFFRSDGKSGSAEYVYDKSGRLSSLKCSGYKLWFSGELVYSHDKSGAPVAALIKMKGEPAGNVTLEYDKHGNLTKEVWDLNGEWSQNFNYEYENKEKNFFYLASPYLKNTESASVTKENYSYCNETGGPSYYYYSKEGRLDKKVFERSDGLKTETKFEYDKAGRLVKSYRMSSDSNSIEFAYEYDGRGNLIIRKYMKGKEMAGYESYVYDANDVLEKAVYKNMDSWLSGTIEFEKDLFDRVAKGHYKGFDGTTAEIIFSYDEKGRTKGMEWKFSDGKSQKYEFEYEEIK